MPKFNKKKKPAPKYGLGGDILAGIQNTGVGILDTAMSALGADTAVDSWYSDNRNMRGYAKTASNYGKQIGKLAPAIAGVAGTAVGGPMAGQAAYAGMQGVQAVGGSLKPEEQPNGYFAQGGTIPKKKTLPLKRDMNDPIDKLYGPTEVDTTRFYKNPYFFMADPNWTLKEQPMDINSEPATQKSNDQIYQALMYQKYLKQQNENKAFNNRKPNSFFDNSSIKTTEYSNGGEVSNSEFIHAPEMGGYFKLRKKK